MAQVPAETAPSVEPAARPPEDYQQIQTNPRQFGGAVAAGAEKLGAGLSNTATFFGQVQTDDALNNAMDRAGKALEKFKGLRGADALHAQADTNAEIDASFKEARDSLFSPAQKYQFDQTARFYRERYIAGQVSSHANQQAEFYATQTNNSTYQRGKDLIAANPDDPDTIRQGLALMHGGRLKNLQLQGLAGDADTLSRETAATNADLMETRIKALAPTNPLRASALLSANRTALAASPNYDALSRMVDAGVVGSYESLGNQNLKAGLDRFNADRANLSPEVQAHLDAFFTPKVKDAQARDTAKGTLSKWSGDYTEKPQGQSPDDLLPTFRLLEGSADNAVSPKGAVGRYQIMPATARQYGLDPARLTDPAYNEQAARTVLTNLSQRYGGDTQAIAVAYNAGPLIADKWIAGGRDNATLPQETQRYLEHLGEIGLKARPIEPAVALGQPLYQTQADYFGAHYDEIVQDARQQAMRDHPDDPHYADTVQARVEQWMSNVITQQRQKYEADNKLLIQAFNGDFSKGARPTSVEEMAATSPAVKDAWDRLQIANPIAAEHIQNQILTANAKANKGEIGFDAPGSEGTYRQILDKVWSSDANDPNRITDPSQVYRFRNQLTQAGFDKLLEQIKQTPAHTQILQMQKDALAAAEIQIVNPLDMPGMQRIEDPKLRRRFDAGFVPAFYAAYDAAINDPKNPKTPWQLLGEGPDNLVDKLMPKFMPSPEEQAAAAVNAKPNDDRGIWERNAPTILGGKTEPGTQGNPIVPKTQADILNAPPGTVFRDPNNPTRLFRKPFAPAQPGAPQP